MKRAGNYLLKRLTFKRLVVLIILLLFALPILKGVFFPSDNGTEPSADNSYQYKFVRGNKDSMNKILEIGVDGTILTENDGSTSPFDLLENQGGTFGYDIKETFRRAAQDDSIKGVLLTINSPGGTIPGSEAISDGIALYKKATGKPVYAHIRDVGASGAYWAAASTDKIFIDEGSLTGSIGVLMGPFTYYDNPTEEGSVLSNVTTQNGIEHTYITAGQYKDTGSPYRRMTPEEIAHWQQSVDGEYAVFVNHVSQTRHIAKDMIINQIKALPYDSQQALRLHLVDAVGNEDVALQQLSDRAGIGDDYQIIQEQRKGDVFSQLFSAIEGVKQPQVTSVCSLCNTPLYLYDSSYSIFKGQ